MNDASNSNKYTATSPFASDNMLFTEFHSDDNQTTDLDEFEIDEDSLYESDSESCDIDKYELGHDHLNKKNSDKNKLHTNISNLINKNVLNSKKLNPQTDDEIMKSLNQNINSKEVSREFKKKTFKQTQQELTNINNIRQLYFEEHLNDPDLEISPIVSIMNDNLTEYERSKLPVC